MKIVALMILSFVCGGLTTIALIFAMTDPVTPMQKTSAVPAKACYRVVT